MRKVQRHQRPDPLERAALTYVGSKTAHIAIAHAKADGLVEEGLFPDGGGELVDAVDLAVELVVRRTHRVAQCDAAARQRDARFHRMHRHGGVAAVMTMRHESASEERLELVV